MSTDTSQRPSTRTQDTAATQEQRTQEAKDAFIASLKSTGSTIDKELRTRAEIIHSNAKGLDKQDKQLQKDTKQLSKDSDAMEKFFSKSQTAIPDVDSFEDDIAKIEAELDMFDDMLDDIDSRNRDLTEDLEEGQPSVSAATHHNASASSAAGPKR